MKCRLRQWYVTVGVAATAAGFGVMSGCSSGQSDAVKFVCQQALHTVSVNTTGQRYVYAYSSSDHVSHASLLMEAEAAGGPVLAADVETRRASQGPAATLAADALVRECHSLGAL